MTSCGIQMSLLRLQVLGVAGYASPAYPTEAFLHESLPKT